MLPGLAPRGRALLVFARLTVSWSFRPAPEPRSGTVSSRRPSRKEVFQPHLPVRLPCYDLAPVTSFALGGSPPTSGARGSHGLTGGVYKARERIHRAMADARLLGTVTDFRDPRPLAGWPPSVPAIVARVSPRT